MIVVEHHNGDVRIRVQDTDASEATGVFESDVDLEMPPAMLRDPSGEHRPVSLTWDQALDDAKQLRRCVVCGCDHLYRKQTIPRLTWFWSLLLIASIALWLVGQAAAWWIFAAFLLVLAIDLTIYVIKPSHHVKCYRCGAEYRGVINSHRIPRWDATTAERFKSSN